MCESVAAETDGDMGGMTGLESLMEVVAVDVDAMVGTAADGCASLVEMVTVDPGFSKAAAMESIAVIGAAAEDGASLMVVIAVHVDAVVGAAAEDGASLMVIIGVDVDAEVSAAAEDGASSEHAVVRAERRGERCEQHTDSLSVFSESPTVSNDTVSESDAVRGSCLMSGSIFTLITVVELCAGTSCNCADSGFTGVTEKATLEMAEEGFTGVTEKAALEMAEEEKDELRREGAAMLEDLLEGGLRNGSLNPGIVYSKSWAREEV